MAISPRILIIDDEEDIRRLISGILEDEGYSVSHAATSDQALSTLEKHIPDLVILDIWLQGSKHDGQEILSLMKQNHPALPVLMISGHGTIETAVSAIKAGAYDFIEKPFKSDRLLLMINRALENAALRKQNQELRNITAQNINSQARLLPEYVQSLLNKAAASNSRIVISGEVGTGKNIAASYVHEHSARSARPLMTLCCTTLHPQRLEKELFGSFHDDSAPGLLQLVDGGSLLLDEVSALPMETQGKILNLLQDGAYYKLGSNQKTPVDVRVLATTAENIEDKVRAGHFRKDLYYRLNVFPIALPPLRQYKNAIPTLISQLSALRFSEQALMALKSYSWPGNIKQLHNVLEWLSLMYLHKEDLRAIDFDQLPQELRNFAPSYGAHNFGNDNSTLFNDVLDLSLRDARESFERYYLVSQINRFDGNISKTAEFIGMERSALHRKLKSLEVFPDDKQNVA